MFLKYILISIFSLQILVACGGGGGSAGGSADAMSVDSDTLSGDKSVGPLALASNEVEHSLCFPEMPSYRELNDAYYNRALLGPIEDFHFNYVIGESEFGSSESTLSFMGQNKDMYDVLAALLFNVKSVSESSQSTPPIYVSEKKPIYNQIRSFCRDVQCTADSIFGDSWGLRFFFKDKLGVLLSGYVDPKTEEYSSDDFLLSAAQAVLSLPKGTFPLNKDNFAYSSHEYGPTNVVIAPILNGERPPTGLENAAGVTRAKRFGHAGAMSLDNVDIYLLEPWKQNREFYNRLYTVFHELIHVLDHAKEKNIILSETNEWLKISDWKQNPQSKEWFMVKDNLKCSEYGASLPVEDFAECGSLYRFAPNRLKKISKAKYNFFKKRVFRGVEYHQVSKCKNSVQTFDL